MTAQVSPPPRSRETRRDLIIAATVIGAFIIVASNSLIDVDEYDAIWGGGQTSQINKLLLMVAVTATVGCWFFWRRWQRLSREATQHRRAEAEAHVMIERMQDITDSATDRYWETDEQHRFVWRTPPKNRVGWSDTQVEHNVIGMTRWEVAGVDPHKDENWRRHLADIEAHRPFRHFRYSHMRRGRVLYKMTSGKPFFDEQGRFKGYRGTATDITRETESEIAALNTQNEFITAIESISDGYALWDADDRLIIGNEQFAATDGHDKIKLDKGMTFAEFAKLLAASGAVGEAAGREDEWVRDTVDKHRNAQAAYNLTCGQRWLEVYEHHLPNGRTLTVTRDMTKQREIERQLQHAQKMETVGQMTGGIAHDFNNLLQVILGNLEMIIDATSVDNRLLQPAKMAKTATERGAELVRRLLAFSRQQTLQPREVDIHAMIDDLGHLLRRVLREDIEVRMALSGELPPIFIDRLQLETALLNIALNARDAMEPGGGLLTIGATHEIIDDESEAARLEIAHGSYVILSIADTGSGMTSDIAARAFEPFFTTKEIGKGTGLGLSMVYGFIRQSGGQVKIHSETGIGTTVKLYLPVSGTESAVAADTTKGVTPILPQGRETILLVEDDDLVRDYASTQLEALGYRVISAINGQAALQTLRDLGGRVDLLFTDIVMPGGMNGRDLAQVVAALYPRIKVLYASGYHTTATPDGRVEAGFPMLEKPYHKANLARKIRELLDSDARPIP